MADGIKVNEGDGPVASTEEVTSLNGESVAAQHVQRLIAALRVGDGTVTDISAGNPFPVDDDATQALLAAIKALLEGTATVKVIDGGGTIGIDDNSSSITVDAPLSSPVGVRLSNGSEALGSTAGRLHIEVATGLPAGNNNIGDVDVATIAGGSNTIGNVGLAPRTSGGLSIFRSLDLDETEEQVKGTAGQVYGYYFANRASTWRYVKLYNATEASVKVGETTPVITLPLPPESAANVPFPHGIAFATAITAAATTGIADNDTGAPAANDVILNLFYA